MRRESRGQATPRITVFQNGIAVQKDRDIAGPTHIAVAKQSVGSEGVAAQPMEDLNTPGPIVLPWHGNEVAFRTIGIVPLPPEGPTHYEPR